MVTALLVAIAFVVVGMGIFKFLNITVTDLMIAGGMLLFIISIRNILVAEVAGKDDLRLAADGTFFGDPDLKNGRPENMTRIAHDDPYIGSRPEFCIVPDLFKKLAGVNGILHRVKCRFRRFTGASALPHGPLLLHFLDVSGIRKHDPAKFGCCLCCVNILAESIDIELRNTSAVINVRMR